MSQETIRRNYYSITFLTILVLMVWMSFTFYVQAGNHRKLPGAKLVSEAGTPPAAKASQLRHRDGKMLAEYGKLPLYFEANQGQFEKPVRFKARGGGYDLFLTSADTVFQFRNVSQTEATSNQPVDTMRMKLVGASSSALIEGTNLLPGKSNYFIGHDPKQWRTDVPQYSKVQYKAVYPGIDLVYYGTQQQLEFDFIVAPGAKPDHIQMRISGAEDLELNHDGDLIIKTKARDVQWTKPSIYQEFDGKKVKIAGGYVIQKNNQVGFQVGDYDVRKPLVIDPIVVLYSTYLGGTDFDEAHGVAVDSAGMAYVTGYTRSLDFPTANALLPTASVGDNAFVIKFNPANSSIIYATYLGGANGCANALDIAVDSGGNAVVVGDTCANSFPLMNPLQPTFAGVSDVFVTKLNATGSGLIFSTYLGGWYTETSTDVAIGPADSVYLTGWTLSYAACATCAFPTTSGAYQTTHNGSYEAFATKINATGSLTYSTFIGSPGDEQGQGIAVDSSGNAIVTGLTSSTAFPTLNAVQPVYGGGFTDAFALKLNPTGTGLVYSTYLGGSSGQPYYSGGRETAQGVAVDAAGNAYVTGLTPSTDFPTLNALEPALNGCVDNRFLVKLDSAGVRQISTYLGGGCADVVGEAVALDSLNNIYVSGSWAVTKINSTGAAKLYSFVLPSNASLVSIAVDNSGRAYVAGGTTSTVLPIVNGFQPTFAGVQDAFFAIIGESNNPPLVSAVGPYTVNEGGTINVTATGSDPDGNALSYAWDLDNNGSFETPGQSVSFSAINLDGPNANTIRVQVTDSGGLSAICGAEFFAYL